MVLINVYSMNLTVQICLYLHGICTPAQFCIAQAKSRSYRIHTQFKAFIFVYMS